MFSPKPWSLRSTCRSFLWLLFHQQPICWVACEAGCCHGVILDWSSGEWGRKRFWQVGWLWNGGSRPAAVQNWSGCSRSPRMTWTNGPQHLHLSAWKKSSCLIAVDYWFFAVPMIGQALSGVFKKIPPRFPILSFCLKRWLPLVPGPSRLPVCWETLVSVFLWAWCGIRMCRFVHRSFSGLFVGCLQVAHGEHLCKTTSG